jgi:hypothetical protein
MVKKMQKSIEKYEEENGSYVNLAFNNERDKQFLVEVYDSETGELFIDDFKTEEEARKFYNEQITN